MLSLLRPCCLRCHSRSPKLTSPSSTAPRTLPTIDRGPAVRINNRARQSSRLTLEDNLDELILTFKYYFRRPPFATLLTPANLLSPRSFLKTPLSQPPKQRGPSSSWQRSPRPRLLSNFRTTKPPRSAHCFFRFLSWIFFFSLLGS